MGVSSIYFPLREARHDHLAQLVRNYLSAHRRWNVARLSFVEAKDKADRMVDDRATYNALFDYIMELDAALAASGPERRDGDADRRIKVEPRWENPANQYKRRGPSDRRQSAPRPDWIAQVLRDVSELPDRNSPDDAPELMLVAPQELRAIIERLAPRPDTQPGEVVVPRSMLVRWREIEHFAWHILDDSEERADTKELVIDQEISGTDLNALIELLPEGHPQSLDDQLKAAPSGRAT